MRKIGFLILLLVVPFSSATAGNLCSYYREHLPSIYEIVCKGPRATRPSTSASSFANGFNIAGAALPAQPTSYGLETIGSYIRTNPGAMTPTFSLIKGYQKIGTGISTSGNNTFYGNDIVERAKGPPLLQDFNPLEPAKSSFPNLNVGTSFELSKRRSDTPVNFGLSLRYNKITSTVGGGPGILISPSIFNIGFGMTREKVSNLIPGVYFFNAILGVNFGLVELEYMLMQNFGGYSLDPIHIGTVTLNLGRFLVTVAARRLNYYQAGTVTQEHVAIQYLFSKHFSAGALYNYLPGANSLAVQLFI